MKKFFITGLLCIALGIVYMYKEDIIRTYHKYFVKTDTTIRLTGKNNYYRNYNFNYVQNTDNFSPNNKQDLYNIYYTAINAGKEKFTFYCPESYKNCINDIKMITSKVNNIKNEIGNDQIDIKQLIKKYHDYIIDHAVYDSERSDSNIIQYKSDTAYGTLLQGYSLCGGYTDSMALFLEDMGIENYKVSSEHHVWNAVKIEDKWYHLDLTWDDPVTPDGTNLIEEDFFLIDTIKLKEIEVEEHTFDEVVYSELKQN